jgi:hypothetical protein
MGKRSRARGRAEKLEAPVAEVGGLELRGAMTAGTRRAYADLAVNAAGSTEDLWQRRVEFLFERLAVAWTIEGVRWEGQKELLARFRAATPDERRAVRDALREHVAATFPDVEAP